MAILILIHVLSITVWVGGMFFAYMALRPAAAATLEPPQRLTLWAATFEKFFFWVWIAIALVLATGLIMIFSYFGGFAHIAKHIHIMFGLGIIMMLIYGHVFFGPYRRLKQAVAAQDWPAGGKKLAQIRWLVAVNLSIGLITIAIASGGKYLM